MAGERSREQLFKEVTTSCTGLVSRIALSCEADAALRRDLIQDILLAVWVALPSFRGESTLRTFVASIAQKRSISHVTRRAREPRPIELPVNLASAAAPPDEIAMRNEVQRQLIESIQLLLIPQREAIVLSLEGFSYVEIGKILGISTNAAMLRCTRAKAALKTIMEDR